MADKAAASSDKEAGTATADVEGTSVQQQQENKNSIYKDAVEASLVSLWTYLFVDIREMAKNGELDGEQEDVEKVLILPLKVSELLKIFKCNIQNLEKKLGPDKDLYLLALEDWVESSTARSKRGILEESIESEIVRFDDDYKEDECVYSVALSHAEKRVVVTFRGSVSMKDWVVDSQAALREIPNPLSCEDDSGDGDENAMETVGIHYGFTEYLYGEYEALKDRGLPTKFVDLGTKKDLPTRRREIRSKVQTILHHVGTLLEQHPDYELEITGHSLGGALATVFAAEAAASLDPRIPKPVVCISIAAPKVGNRPFRLMIEGLEQQGKLQLLRVRNEGDVVPLIPDLALNVHKHSFLNRRYTNCGVQLVLKKDCIGGYKLYPKITKKRHFFGYHCLMESGKKAKHCVIPLLIIPILCVLGCTPCCAAANAHGCGEYFRRLERNKEALRETYLDDIYEKYYPQEIEQVDHRR